MKDEDEMVYVRYGNGLSQVTAMIRPQRSYTDDNGNRWHVIGRSAAKRLEKKVNGVFLFGHEVWTEQTASDIWRVAYGTTPDEEK